jgi:hypothetical protein
MIRLVMIAAIIAVPFGGQWAQAGLVALAALLVFAEMREKERAEAREKIALDRAEQSEWLLRSMAEALGYARQASKALPAPPNADERPYSDKWH